MRIAAGLSVMFAIASSANAQWTAVNLDPAGSIDSRAFGVGGGQQVGVARVGDLSRASLWTGTAASWVDLHPAGATHSSANGVSGGQQVGNAIVGGVFRASLWTGTAASWVDLSPAGAPFSQALGVSGGQQVGWASVGGVNRACLWTGTAASLVDLHPAGAAASIANGVGGGQQVGYAIFVGGAQRASLWTGTAASWVELSPAGATSSQALGVGGGQQVGYAIVGGAQRASLWTGTAASFVDLHPAGATSSVARDVDDGQQVGYAIMGGVNRASLWTGTAASWVDLHAYLPPGFSLSQATGIWGDGSSTYVVGFGVASSGNMVALMWVLAPNAPPVAIDDYYGVDQLGTLTEAAPGVLVNDSDPDTGDTLTAVLVDGPLHAAFFELNSDGSFTYVPEASFYGVDTFTYKVYDGTVSSETATVSITVRQPGSEGFITGGGKFFQDGRKCTFGFVAKVQGSGVQGHLEFQDHDMGLDVKSESVGWVYAPNQIDGYFSGMCSVNQVSGYTYFVQVHDRGQPGSNDDFTVWIYEPGGALLYSSGGLLSGGNIVIHGQ